MNWSEIAAVVAIVGTIVGTGGVVIGILRSLINDGSARLKAHTDDEMNELREVNANVRELQQSDTISRKENHLAHEAIQEKLSNQGADIAVMKARHDREDREHDNR